MHTVSHYRADKTIFFAQRQAVVNEHTLFVCIVVRKTEIETMAHSIKIEQSCSSQNIRKYYAIETYFLCPCPL